MFVLFFYFTLISGILRVSLHHPSVQAAFGRVIYGKKALNFSIIIRMSHKTTLVTTTTYREAHIRKCVQPPLSSGVCGCVGRRGTPRLIWLMSDSPQSKTSHSLIIDRHVFVAEYFTNNIIVCYAINIDNQVCFLHI